VTTHDLHDAPLAGLAAYGGTLLDPIDDDRDRALADERRAQRALLAHQPAIVETLEFQSYPAAAAALGDAHLAE
jgi:hypothetical protein